MQAEALAATVCVRLSAGDYDGLYRHARASGLTVPEIVRRQVALMSDLEQLEWVRMLGKNRRARIAVIIDLLAHANEDRMSPEDRTICYRQLQRMGLDRDEINRLIDTPRGKRSAAA